MDDSISRLQKAVYANHAEPEEWFAIARRLEAAALTLQQHHPRSEDPSAAIEDRAQEFMLWGFCIENLMKGLLARKKLQEGGSIINEKSDVAKYDGPQHKLNKIADEISFTRTIEEHLALDFFTKATIYFGRYPLPLSSKDLAVYWEDHFSDALKTLLTRLKKETGTQGNTNPA